MSDTIFVEEEFDNSREMKYTEMYFNSRRKIYNSTENIQ